MRLMRTRTWAILLFLAVLAFYFFTLQPSLAWGDGIRLQQEVVTAESFILAEIIGVEFAPDPLPFSRLGVAAWDHPLYVMLGHTLLRLLPGVYDLWLVNLLSAVFGAGAIALLFLLCARHTQSRSASLLAALALAVSHTFWWHAVTPEVYTLFAFLLLLALYWFDTYEQNGRFLYLFASALALGLGIANHLLAGLAIPALILYLLLARKSRRDFPLKLSQILWLGVAFLLGLSPYLAQFLRLLRSFSWPEVMGTAVGMTFLQGSISFSPMLLAQSFASYLIFLFYQFLLLGVLLGLYGWWAGRRAYPALWNKAAAFYLVYLAFGLIYRVSDQFAFFLGAHLFWAVAIAMGIAQLQAAVWPDRRRLLAIILALPLLARPLFYETAPDLLRAADITEEVFGVPQVGSGVRDGLAYYVNPDKRGDVDAYAFGAQTLTYLPQDAIVIAEWYTDTDEFFVLRYFTAVQGLRPDVELVTWITENPFAFNSGQALQVVADALAHRPVYLASLSEAFYDAPTLLAEYCIVPEHNLYRVYPRADAAQRPCLPPDTEHLMP
jgi:hypothetical protein